MSTQLTLADDEGLDFRSLILHLWTHKWRILSLGLIGGVIALVIGFLMTPVYRATVVMVPANMDRNSLSGALGSALGSLGGIASLAGVSVGGADVEVEEALAVMRSRQFTEAFLRDLNLLPVLYAEDWDAAGKKWKAETREQPSLGRAFKRFDQGMRSITRDKKTGLVTLTVDWRDRQQASDWANILVSRLNAEMRARAIAQSDASLQYLNRELGATQVVDTREAINRLIESQIRQRMIASVTQEFAFRVVDGAMKPELSDKVRPKRAIMAFIGALIGGFIGVLWVYLRSPPDAPRPDAGSSTARTEL